MNNNTKQLIDNFFSARKSAGWSLRVAASYLGVSHSYLCKVEGCRKEPSKKFVGRIETLLELVTSNLDGKPI